MLASLAKNTLSQYSVTYKLWWQFCTNVNTDPYISSLPSVLTFLTDQFNEGAAYGTLNNHRSALSLLFGNDLGSDEQIKRLMKGVFKSRPTLPKYSFTWDPQIVLDYISQWTPNKDLTLTKITKKLVILLALCTARRVQTLSLIKICNIHIEHRGIRININDIIKTSGVGRDQPVLFLPYFDQNQDICPAAVLKDYLSCTKDIRPDSLQNLLLTVKPPHRAATAQTISRWVKQVLAESGVDVAAFSAHSTRHAATSTARAQGLSFDVIRKTAGWTENSRTFATFYNRPIIDQSQFANSVCLRNKDL